MSNAKQRWNEKHYTQIKVSVKKDIASAFKSACTEKEESQAGVLSRAMLEYADEPPPEKINKKINDDDKYGTRRKRRKMVSDALVLLENILNAEESYRENIPSNFLSRQEIAEETISKLEEAIDALQNSYT